MSALVTITIIVPLLAAGLGIVLRNGNPIIRDAATLTGLVAAAAASLGILWSVQADGTQVIRVGGWSPELGIVLVADLFAALVLPVALVIIVIVQLFALGQRRTAWAANPALSGPLLGVLTAGVSMAMLTGDLFTLFVSFELILVSSYVLLTHQGRRGQVRSGMTYVVMNLLASTLFLLGLAFVYAAAGTINMALLAERIPQLDDGVRIGIGAWFFVVFGTKAAVFPLFSWLPDSYPTAPTTITAVFAGLLTKIGIYSMIRFHTLMGMDELGPIMLIAAGITMIIGALGALAQSDVKRILSFHVISQIGYMLMGLALFSAAGIAGSILFVVHHMPVKTVLFLVGGLIENEEGTSSLDRSGGLARRRPLVALLFAIPALSLAGLPPFSGFVAKLSVIRAGIEAAETPIVIAALVAGALTLLSMTKIWLGVFWGRDVDGSSPIPTAPAARRTMEGATALAIVGSLIISLFAGTLFDLSTEAADDLRDPAAYIGPVLDLDQTAAEGVGS
ncbi:MAG: proton-conducting transporter membrane subunit [Actinomycetota bacterium]